MSVAYQEVRDHTLRYFQEKLTENDLTKRIKDLPIDSLDFFEFTMSLEEKFNVEVKTDTLNTNVTLEQFCRAVGNGE